jgi:uncharacterized membrane protein
MSYNGPPPPPQYPMPPGMQPYGPVPGNNGKAIAALVCGIVGLLCCSPLGIVGLVLGYSAKGEIDRSNGTQRGRGMAVAGIVLGWIAIALLVLEIIGFATGVIHVHGHAGTTN